MEAGFSKVLRSEDCFVSAAFLAAIAATGYDLSILDVSSQVFLEEVDKRLGRPTSDATKSKILAAKATYMTDLVYTRLPLFINFCNLAANRTPIDPLTLDLADAYEVAWSLVELSLLDPTQEEELIDPEDPNPFMRRTNRPKTSTMKFSTEIRKYMGVILAAEGAIKPIDLIPMAIMPRDVGLDDPSLAELAVESHQMVEIAVREFVLNQLDELFSQLGLIRNQQGRPILSEEEMRAIRKTIEGGDDGEQGEEDRPSLD